MRRLLTPTGGLLVFAVIAGLVVGGLGWVTVAALRVEDAQLAASARADDANKERLALWQLDSRLLPILGVETNRPYAHYFATSIPYPVVLPEGAGPDAEPGRVTSPLLTGELPDWMLLHFQVDLDAGWSSPQVISADLDAKLRSQPGGPVTLANATPGRRGLLDKLWASFPKEDVLMTLSDRELSDQSDSPLAVPLNPAEPPSPVPPPGGGFGARVDAAGGRDGAASRYQLGAGIQAAPKAGVPGDEATREGGERGRSYGQAPGNPPPAPTGPPAAGFGGQSADRGVQPPRPENPTPPPQTNTTDLAKGAGSKQVADPDYMNNSAQVRRETGKKGLQEVQNRGGTAPDPFYMKPFGPPAAEPADSVKRERGKHAEQEKPAPAAPAPTQPTAGGLAGSRNEPAPRSRAAKPPGPTRGDAGVKTDPRPGDEQLGQTERETGKAAKKTTPDSPTPQQKLEDPKRGMLALNKDLANPPTGPAADAKRVVPNLRPPAVHLGAMRPQWLHAPDGTVYLLLVRAARVEAKTVFQGVVLDWPRLREVLQDEVRPLFPEAELRPVFAAADVSERTMTAVPARLDPGPAAAPPPAGWTPLRLGLVIAWVAAVVALIAVGVGGWSLIDLSERRIRFVSAVTHELRTPLTSLRLYLDLLTSGMIADEGQQREYLTTLHGESERLHRLIDNVLDFARLEKRSVRAHRQPMKLADLLDQVKQTWAERCAADGKDLVVISTLPPDQEVCTDARMAAQVVGNLIDNARKYTREAADRRIWVWAKPGTRRRIVLEVEDRGPGVAAAERCSIFRPFRRGQTADTAAGGAGLGLALAKQWAEVLGGALTCRAADGGTGACFRLELPVR